MQVRDELGLAVRRQRRADRLLHRRGRPAWRSGSCWRPGSTSWSARRGGSGPSAPGRAADRAGRACVVLDEADEMLGADFRAELETVLGALPAERQTLMFAATMSAGVEALARRFQRDALRIDVGGAARTSRCRRWRWRGRTGRRAIVNLLRLHEARRGDRVLRPARGGGAAGRAAGRARLPVVGAVGRAHPARAQRGAGGDARGRARVCVATDLAARGFDLPGLDLVLHADLPVQRRGAAAPVGAHRAGRAATGWRSWWCRAAAPAGGGAGGAGGAERSPGSRRRTAARWRRATSSGCWPTAAAEPARRGRAGRRGFWRRMAPSGSRRPTGGSGRRCGRRRRR